MSRELSCSGLSPAITRRRSWDWRVALVLVIGLAAVVRLAHLGHSSLTGDEAARAHNAWSASWDLVRWFPPLQYAILWTTRHAVGESEFVLRLPNALAGLACVVVLFLFVRKHVDPWSGVCVATVAAFHAELLIYSRMIKEFSIEALMCALVTWMGVEAYQTLTRKRLLAFLSVALLSIGLTYTGPLVAGSWVMVLAWGAARNHAERRRRLTDLACLVGVLTLAGVLSLLWFSGAHHRGDASVWYGGFGGAWPKDYHIATLAQWFARQSYGALQFLLGIKRIWWGFEPPADTLIAGFGIMLAAASVSGLWRRLPSFCVASMLIFGFTVAAGALKLWPYGPYHMMSFLVPFMCILIGCGLRGIAGKLGPSLSFATIVVMCVLIPGARAVRDTVITPSETQQLGPVLQYVDQHVQPGDGIFAYYATEPALRYYWKRDDIDILFQPRDHRGHLKEFAQLFESFMGDHERVWFVFTHTWYDEQDVWVAYLKERYRLVDSLVVSDAFTHLFEPISEDGPSDTVEVLSKYTGLSGVPRKEPRNPQHP